MSVLPTFDLRTGHPQIDEEHGTLLGLLGRLESVCVLHKGSACGMCLRSQRNECWMSLIDILAKVFGYTVDHFAFEEKAMCGLPDAPEKGSHRAAHIEDHERIVATLRDMMLAVDSPDVGTVGSDLEFIVRGWLAEHITKFDIPLVAMLQTGR